MLTCQNGDKNVKYVISFILTDLKYSAYMPHPKLKTNDGYDFFITSVTRKIISNANLLPLNRLLTILNKSDSI